MTTCLVTGGCGFIGSHLVERLVAAGHSVRVLDDLSTGRRDNVQAVWDAIDYRWDSIMDRQALRAALRGVCWVFHLAALPSVQRSVEDPLTTHAVCATGTLLLLEEACRAGVDRVVYAASSSAYGDASGVVRREDDPCRPLSPDAAAKLAGEHYCRCYTEVFGLETVRLRFFNVYGPRQDPHSPYAGVVARFVAAVGRGQPPAIHGDGRQSRDFTYVGDAVQALLLAASAPAAVGKVYNVGNGARTSVRELLRHLGELAGMELAPVWCAARAGDVRHAQADISLARRELDYSPRVSLRDGLRRTLEHHAGQAGGPAGEKCS